METAVRSGVLRPTRFNIAVHLLIVLAKDGDICPSSQLADRVNTHATFVRRIIAHLVKAGIVEAKQGRGGGYTLGRSPAEIRLGEVSRALQAFDTESDIGCIEECPPTGDWTATLGEIVDEAERQWLQALDRYTLADLLREDG